MGEERPYVRPLRTKTGKVLSEEDLEGYVEEAERGYDVDQIRPVGPIRTWRCELQFDLRTGEFSKEADLLLTKRGVSRVVQAEGRYRYQCTVPAEMFNYALSGAAANLAAILNAYDVTFEVVEARVAAESR